MDNLQSLRYFGPESVLTVAVLAMFIQDLLTRKSARREIDLTIGGLVWLGLTAIALWQAPAGDVALFGGLLQHDPLRIFFGWLFLGAALLTIIIVPKSQQVSSARLGEFTAL